jgi:nucleoid DNA-binding protein
MNKAELIEIIAGEADITEASAECALSSTIEIILRLELS